MKILIVEDERPIAEDIRSLTKEILGERAGSIRIETTLENARLYLSAHDIDVLLLDLNLNDRDGFELLKWAVSRSFHTILISAHVERALEAFEYGVLDFIPKPYNKKRLAAAFARLQNEGDAAGRALRYLTVRKQEALEIVPLRDIKFFKAADVYTELHLADGRIALCDKSLKRIGDLLTAEYLRIHKSFIVDMNRVRRLLVHGGGRYQAELSGGDRLPVSRRCYPSLKEKLGGPGPG